MAMTSRRATSAAVPSRCLEADTTAALRPIIEQAFSLGVLGPFSAACFQNNDASDDVRDL